MMGHVSERRLGLPSRSVVVAKKVWQKPEVKRIAAGSAESGKDPGNDANVNNTRS